eukprot:TRINITY_DN64994_c0_g1_i1.p1 TRINITY_DN64994_c0_g1~~TRINITY_DN64994_c0_g1_i1.p1  ORF type:complete len:128 (+),score=13.63 TRINITY_DN64994_c0_g1_i1:1-384(+)
MARRRWVFLLLLNRQPIGKCQWQVAATITQIDLARHATLRILTLFCLCIHPVILKSEHFQSQQIIAIHLQVEDLLIDLSLLSHTLVWKKIDAWISRQLCGEPLSAEIGSVACIASQAFDHAIGTGLH